MMGRIIRAVAVLTLASALTLPATSAMASSCNVAHRAPHPLACVD